MKALEYPAFCKESSRVLLRPNETHLKEYDKKRMIDWLMISCVAPSEGNISILIIRRKVYKNAAGLNEEYNKQNNMKSYQHATQLHFVAQYSTSADSAQHMKKLPRIIDLTWRSCIPESM